MFQEKIIEYWPWTALATEGVALGLRLGQFGLEALGQPGVAEGCRLAAVGLTTAGSVLVSMDGGMMLGVRAMGMKEFFGNLADWTRQERMVAYLLSGVNSYFALSDKYRS